MLLSSGLRRSLSRCDKNYMRKAEQALHVNPHGKQLVMPLFVERWMGKKTIFDHESKPTPHP